MAWDKLFNGDCLKVLPTLPRASVDLLLVDLPYGTTTCEWDSIIPLQPLWEELRRVVKPKGAMVFTADEPFTSLLVMSNVREFRYRWTWVKKNPTGFMNANRMPLKNVEDVAVFYRSLPVYNPQGVLRTDGRKAPRGTKGGIYGNNSANYGKDDRLPALFGSASKRRNTRGSVGRAYGGHGISNENLETEYTNHPRQTLNFGRDGTIDKPVHPTQKPLALMSYFIRTYSNAGDTVLDCCMGSGTTGVAAIALGRNFYGIEQDSDYYALSKERIKGARSPFDSFRVQPGTNRSDAKPRTARPVRKANPARG